MRKLLKWHGGKIHILNELVSIFLPLLKNKVYVETHFGGGTLFFGLDGCFTGAIINDVDSEVCNFWTVVRDSHEALQRRLALCSFDESEWSNSFICTDDPVERAARFFIRYRMSRQATGRTFATVSTTRFRREMVEQVSAWLGALEMLPEVAALLKSIVIYQRDGTELILQNAAKTDVVFYVDPPYVPNTRTTPNVYSHEMTEFEHTKLVSALADVEGVFVLSGYANPLYDNMGWYKRVIPVFSPAKKCVVEECLWSNKDILNG